VQKFYKAVVANDTDHLGKMVSLERCGSGSQYEMSGWIMKLIFKSKSKVQLEGLPPHIVSMKYKNMDTGREFKLFCGLTESRMDEDFLVPDYGSYVVELKTAETVS
jgi:hypothetical protein